MMILIHAARRLQGNTYADYRMTPIALSVEVPYFGAALRNSRAWRIHSFHIWLHRPVAPPRAVRDTQQFSNFHKRGGATAECSYLL